MSATAPALPIVDLDEESSFRPSASMARRARRNRRLVVGAALILVALVVALAAPLIAPYSPIDQARLTKSAAVKRIADRNEATPSQIALAWVLRQPGVIAIPKASDRDHVRANRGALEVHLGQDDLRELDRAYPPPSRKTQLEVI